MDSTSPRVDFAVIGHQDSWSNVHSFVNGIRDSAQERLSLEKVKSIFPFIPPRDLFRVNVKSKTGAEINGVYIETFIEPDKLGVQYVRHNLNKVKEAMVLAIKMGARIVTMGGFTSIVIEGNFSSYASDETNFTTGNTLTAALIVKGIEKAVHRKQLNLKELNILIIGATGDIGSACVRYLEGNTRKLLLCARNQRRLKKLSDKLSKKNVTNEYSTNLDDLSHKSDVIICVASSTEMKLSNLKENVIICDAGYPKNIDNEIDKNSKFVFHGGMGQVTAGYTFNPDYTNSFYKYPAPHITHGCILEAMTLALENRFENYSFGKGNITVEKINKIYEWSLKHGIIISPFYNNEGLLDINQ